jgi:hypothetical protein
MTKTRREKTQINKIRNNKGEITTNTKEIIRDYFKNLYSNKLESLEEIDKLLDTYDHPKLNQETINHLSRSTACKKVEAAIVSHKSPGSVGFTAETYQTFKELTPTLFQLFHEIEREGALPNSFYEAVLHSSLNWTRTHTKKKELQGNFFNEHRRKNLQ